MSDFELFRKAMTCTPLLRNLVRAPVLLSLMAAAACSSSGSDHGGKDSGVQKEGAGGSAASPSPRASDDAGEPRADSGSVAKSIGKEGGTVESTTAHARLVV